MKIVCGSCQAKYSIADEKVAGKVFKIRCKRCSEVIVVRGDQEDAGAGHAPAAEAAPEEAAPDAIWHVVVNGEQAGPFGPAHLSQMLSGGELDWEAYVWTEGFENWLPMRDVPELVSAISGPGPDRREAAEQPVPVRVAAQQQQPLAAAVGGYPVQPSMGADPFADDSATTAGVFASSLAQPAPRSNLFVAGNADSPFDASEGRGMASASGPRVSMEQAMTGARNENSVLFSLKNLQALATGSTSPSAPAAPSTRPGFASGEGSGLIDIRALATATGVNDQGKHAAEKDALLSLGSTQASAFGALGSPMLAPGRSDEEGSKKGLVLAIVGGFALLAIAGIGAAVILKPAQTAPTEVGPVVPQPPPSAAASPAAPAAPAPVEAPSEGELASQRKLQEQQAAAAAAAPPPVAAGPVESAHKGAGGAKRPNERVERPSEPTAAKPEPAIKPEAAPKSKSSSSIDDLLDSAIGGSGKPRGGAAAESTANLPEKPSREDVLSAMNGVKAGVSACAKGAGGVAFANVTVAGKSGKVSNVEVTGMTGEVGSCIARTVRGAKFSRFKADNFQVKFPFRL